MTQPLVETLLSPLIQSFLTVTELSTVLPISVEIWGGGVRDCERDEGVGTWVYEGCERVL